MNTIAILGAGNLGSSLATGLVKSGKYAPEQFILSRRKLNKLEPFKAEGYQITSSNIEAVQQADIIVLSVLPQKVDEVLDEIKAVLRPDQLLISLVTGVKIFQLKAKLSAEHQIVRAMPNTAIAINESMTCVAGDKSQKENLDFTKELFDLVGESVIINEEQMTSATALVACGIAFFLRAIRAASQGGTEIDFHANEALKMAAQTAKGAASLLLANNSHPEDEIDKVTSPKGCTIAGLNEMEHSGFSSSFIKGIITSAEKAEELYCN